MIKTKPLSFDEIIQPTFTNMWLLGLPIEENCPVKIRFVIFFVNVFLVIIEETAFLINVMDADHFLEATALAPCLSIGILCLCKAFVMFWNRQRIVRIINILKVLQDNMTEDDLKVEETEYYWNFVRILSKSYFVLNQILIWVYNFIPFVLMTAEWYTSGSMPWLLPYDILLPFEINSWPIYFLVYIHGMTAGVSTVIALVAADSMYFVLTTQVCVHFAVLSYKLEHLNTDNCHILVNVVKRHQELIGISDDLEEIFSPSLLLNFVASSLEICLLGFNIIAGDVAYLPPFLLFLTSALTQIFLISMFGDMLIAESESVAQAAYLCEWYQLDRRSQVLLILLRERARRPQSLTAMKFVTMSYATFSKDERGKNEEIISNSFSYFTILNTIYSPPTK